MLVGARPTLYCNYNQYAQSVNWNYLSSPTSAPQTIVVNTCQVVEYLTDVYGVNSFVNVSCTLIVLNATMDLAGQYSCSISNSPRRPAVYQLIVVGKKSFI